MESLKFLDLFAGIGGFRLGMEKAGHECVGHVEWDKFARKSYEAIFETEGDYTENDIRAVRADELPRANIWCFGFPCQDISIAGSQEGFDGERSSLFYAVTRLIRDLKKENKPEYLFIENVKNLLSVNDGFDFLRLQVELDEIGYNLEWDVLNSKHFGVPQNRERIFIIGHLRTASTRKVFPFAREGESVDREQPKINIVGTTSPYNDLSKHTRERTFGIDGLMGALTATDYKTPKQILIGNTNPSGRGMNGNVFDSEGVAPTITTNKGEGAKIAIPVLTPDRIEKQQNGRRFKDNDDEMFTLTAQDRHGVMVAGNLQGNHDQNNRVYDPTGIAPTLTTMQGGGQEPKIIQKENGIVVGKIKSKGFKNNGNIYSTQGVAPTVTTRNNGDQGIKIKEGTDRFRIRKLTPRECWRLQGFPDWAFDKAATVNSNSQLYKQAGNSVTVPVIYEIAKRLEVYA